MNFPSPEGKNSFLTKLEVTICCFSDIQSLGLKLPVYAVTSPPTWSDALGKSGLKLSYWLMAANNGPAL